MSTQAQLLPLMLDFNCFGLDPNSAANMSVCAYANITGTFRINFGSILDAQIWCKLLQHKQNFDDSGLLSCGLSSVQLLALCQNDPCYNHGVFTVVYM